ncbi:hypothetical protein LN042_30520 [Kitasatospora sp. RB6PN24]|uniref:hypothetical protein n=1 Tax=Kitasatospora humi TaxID=2893891 RepID=UPI001E39B538|nr:hypothetical protein [Kitasatospora humi]MCC9311346.1 hypothetical protein [Kitasatospora humi]
MPGSRPAKVWVEGYDPGSWKKTVSVEFTLPAQAVVSTAGGQLSALQDLCAGNFPVPGGDDGAASDRAFGPRVRELFDHDFSRLAVVTTDDKTGASHVGYVDRAGKFTDLTGTASGFSSTPHEQDALFAPDGGSVWFTYRDPGGQFHIASRALTSDHRLVDQWSGPTDGADDLDLQLGGSPLRAVVGGTVRFGPDGRRAAGFIDGAGDNVVAVPSSGVLKTNGDAGAITDQDCDPSGWVDDHTLLCAPRGLSPAQPPYQNNLWTLDVDRMHPGDYEHAKDAASPPLLPATDRKNLPEVVSPDGKKLLFRSVQGKDENAFVTDLTPGAQPQQITAPEAATALGSGDCVLEWR